MKPAIAFYFDVGSPAAYLAWTQLPAIARAVGADIDHRPMLLGGVFQATGNRSPMEVPAKAQYMQDDSASRRATACPSATTRTSRSTPCC